MRKKLGQLGDAYKALLLELYKEAPFMIIFTFILTIALGLMAPLSVFVNTHIFNDGIAVASGDMLFGEYMPYLILFIIISVLPPLIDNVFIYGYVDSRCRLILRTRLKGRMLKKLKKLKYEHFESEASMEIIDKAYNRVEDAARHMFAIILLAMGKITIGQLGVVMALTKTLIHDTSTLFSLAATFLSKKNESAMFFDLMDLPSEKLEGEDIGEIKEIRAENIKYRYPLTDKYVLEEVNPKGRYELLSVVSQETVQYTTYTLDENIFIRDTGKVKDEKKIDESIAFAGLGGTDKTTLLGKDVGGDLSGGQWQKVAIAGGYYRNRDFIILDEPTGNLDPLAETEIFKKYLEMAQDKTVIIVTHRISAASLADRIIVFSHGAIVEDGTHESLMSHKGEYSRLYTAQAKWYDR